MLLYGGKSHLQDASTVNTPDHDHSGTRRPEKLMSCHSWAYRRCPSNEEPKAFRTRQHVSQNAFLAWQALPVLSTCTDHNSHNSLSRLCNRALPVHQIRLPLSTLHSPHSPLSRLSTCKHGPYDKDRISQCGSIFPRFVNQIPIDRDNLDLAKIIQL